MQNKAAVAWNYRTFLLWNYKICSETMVTEVFQENPIPCEV